MQRIFWIEGEGGTLRLKVLHEFSLTDFTCQIYVWDETVHTRPVCKPIDEKKLRSMKEFVIDGQIYTVLWVRRESDDRGSYLVAGMRMSY
jgi:hypothetical protein